jgi:hypothetical protein
MVPIPNIMIRLASALDASMLAELGARTFSETFSADNAAEDMAAYVGSSFSVAAQAAELADPHHLSYRGNRRRRVGLREAPCGSAGGRR